jgi:transcriptional regulator with XRE-family HTH domain
MHALRRFIQSELDSRGWQARDLVKASGLSKQLVSNFLNDDRDILPQLPRTTTLEALAKAFNVSTAHVTTVAVEALGVPGVNAPAVVHEIESVEDEVLLRELLRRAVAREEDAPAPVDIRGRVQSRPATTLEGQLELAEEALADFDRLAVAGESAERKRAELQARVDDLKSEIVSSRRVTGQSRSVTGL